MFNIINITTCIGTEGAKDATAQTKSANDALYGQLPFTDKTDFMNAHKGFIAPLPSELIKGKQGNVVWDPQQYAFIKEGEKPRTRLIQACGGSRS